MKNQKKKSLAQVEHPPEKHPQLDGDEDEKENDKDDNEEGMTKVEKLNITRSWK